jgi:hypothetical protein
MALPKGAVDCFARRFKVALQRVEHLIAPLACLPLCGNSGSDGARADDSQQCVLNCVAFTPTDVTVAAATTVTWANRDVMPHMVSTGSGPGGFGKRALTAAVLVRAG